MTDDTSTIQGKELKNTVILAISFNLAYTAYASIEKLQSSLNEENNLGVISLSFVYGTFILFGFLAPTLIRLTGVKNTIILAWVCHLLYTASNFYPDYKILIPASVIFGAISPLLWTCQSTYVTACAYSLAKYTNQTPYAALSKLLGIFFTIVELNGVTGNLISSLVLQQLSNNQTEGGLCGASFCPSDVNATTIDRPDDEIVYTLLGVYLAFGLVALVVTVLFLSPLPKTSWANTMSLKESLSSFFVTLFRTKLVFLVPLMMFLDMQQAFLTGDYTRAYISCPVGIHMVGFVLAGHCASVAAFNLIVSRVARYTGRYVLFAVAVLTQAGSCVFFYRWTPSEDDIVLIFVVPVAWAISVVVWVTQAQALIGLFFPDRKEPAFANYHVWKAVGSTVMYALSTTMCIQSKLLTLLIILGVATVLYTGVEIHYKVTQTTKKRAEYEKLSQEITQ